VYSENIVYIEC